MKNDRVGWIVISELLMYIFLNKSHSVLLYVAL